MNDQFNEYISQELGIKNLTKISSETLSNECEFEIEDNNININENYLYPKKLIFNSSSDLFPKKNFAFGKNDIKDIFGFKKFLFVFFNKEFDKAPNCVYFCSSSFPLL